MFIEYILFNMGNYSSCSTGKNPIQGLLWNKEKTGMYGVTESGGEFGHGTIFFISMYGISTIFSFDDPYGKHPFSKPVLDEENNVLYGTTLFGGKYNYGTIYMFDLDTKIMKTIYDFDILSTGQILSNLTIVGNKIFGCSTYGGNDRMGSIFCVNKVGTNFKVLHSFSGVDGKNPLCSLFLNGFTLYGTTLSGGEFDKGTLFRIYTNGTSFKTLASFNGKNGVSPTGNLTIYNNIIYGTSMFGGVNGSGVIFMFNMKTLRLNSAYSFTNQTEGIPMFGGLTITNNGLLIGATTQGGIEQGGSIYSFDVESKNFRIFHNFSGGYDGSSFMGQLIFDRQGSKMFGITYNGGFNECGTIFGYDLSNNTKFTFPFFGQSSDNLYKLDSFLDMTVDQFNKLRIEETKHKKQPEEQPPVQPVLPTLSAQST